MNIWRWVTATTRELRANGQTRLADLIEELPSIVCDDEHGRVEAVVPEALALARAAKLPWLEVFVRHWALQSRVLHRFEARQNLPEAVALLEFANRSETKACPQSVCVTQDLASCYACADGPGYVAERLAVARETLERIDPTWPCFECISAEYAGALLDEGKAEEALAFVERQMAAAVASGDPDGGDGMMHSKVEALLALGREQDALAALEDHEHPEGGSGYEVDGRLLTARALCGLGRPDDAVDVFPPFDVIVETPSCYEDWTRVAVALVGAGTWENTSEFGLRLRVLFENLERNGAWFRAVETARIAAELALGRGARVMAGASLDDAERLLTRLRKPDEPRAAIDALRARIVHDPEPLADDPDLQLEDLPDDTERALDVLALAHERWPEHGGVAVALARAARACKLPALAEAVLRGLVAFGDEADDAIYQLGHLLLAGGRHEELEVLVSSAMQSELLETRGLWLLAESAVRQGETAQGAAHLRAVVSLDPDAEVPRARLATLERELGNHQAALAQLDHLVSEGPPGAHDWDRMTTAAILGDWKRLRESAARLNFPLAEVENGEGPIDVGMGVCRIQIEDEEGSTHEYLAERRGPVTARIVQMAGPTRTEYFGALVVFDAEPLDDGAELESDDDDGDATRVFLYRSVHVLEPSGRRTWTLDGVMPDDDRWVALEDVLQDLGGAISIRSGDDYQHVDPNDAGVHLPGVYAFLCMPVELDADVLHSTLRGVTRDWPHPVVWPDIAKALRNGETREGELARQQTIVDAYEL